MYTQLGVLTKGTVIEVNVSELGMVTAGGKVVFGKYAQITNNPENDGCINAVLRMSFLLLLLIYILITCNPSCVTTALHDIPALLQSHYSSSESLSMWILYYVPTVVKPKSGFMTSIIIADIDCTPYTSSTLRKGGFCFRHDLF